MIKRTAQHFIEITRGAFPPDGRLVDREQSGDLCIFIDWRLGTDPERPSKRSRLIVVRVSHEAMDDYANSDERQRNAGDVRLKSYLAHKLAGFDPEHDAAAHVSPPREEWLVTTGMLNP